MSPRLFALALLPLVFAFGISSLPAQVAGDTVEKKDALDAMTPWLQELDQAEYDQSWREASKKLQQNYTAEQWQNYVQGLRGTLGRNLDRTPGSVLLQNGVPPAPASAQPPVQPDQTAAAREYVVAQYDSSFENLKYAVETVTFVKETDGTWRAVSYMVKAKTTGNTQGPT